MLQLLSLGIIVSLLLIYIHSLMMQFPKGDVPEWVCNAMDVAGIDISSCCVPLSWVILSETINNFE